MDSGESEVGDLAVGVLVAAAGRAVVLGETAGLAGAAVRREVVAGGLVTAAGALETGFVLHVAAAVGHWVAGRRQAELALVAAAGLAALVGLLVVH